MIMTLIGSWIAFLLEIILIGFSFWLRKKGILKSIVWTIVGFTFIASAGGMLVDGVISSIKLFPLITVGLITDLCGAGFAALIGLIFVVKKGFKTALDLNQKRNNDT